MSDSEDCDFFNELQNEIKKEQEGIVEKRPRKDSKPIDVDSRSGLRLKRRLVSAAKCDTGLKNVEFVPLRNVETRTKLFNSIHVGVKPSPHWATIGVVDKFFDQSDFCVTRFTDMRGTYTNVYITGKAFLKFQNEIGMGSVIAIKRPFLLLPTEANHSIGLQVDQLQQMWVIGQSLDLIQCSSYVRKDKQCDEWTDIRSGDYCDKHLERVCNYSKNGRMELASGDSGFDIRWATQTRQADGKIAYESKVDPTSKALKYGLRSKLKEAYYIKGKGLVAVDGSLVKKTLQPKKAATAAEKAELEEFLKGRRDPGAEMIRRVKGIKDESPRTALSKEALDKMGIGLKMLSKEEEEAKKRSFEALNKATDDESQKKPRYVYL